MTPNQEMLLMHSLQTSSCKINISLKIADWSLSSRELVSGNSIGAFSPDPAPLLDKISGPMGRDFCPVLGWGLATSEGEHKFPHWKNLVSHKMIP